MTTAKEYENEVGELLDAYFAGIDTVCVRVRKSLRYRSERGYRNYSPIIDISVGPFAETPGTHLHNEFDQLVTYSGGFIDRILTEFRQNYRHFGEGFFDFEERNIPASHREFLSTNTGANWNARCYIAIEVEDSGDTKHLLGDLVNVGISGRIGIAIGFNGDKFKAFMRQLDYLAYTIEAHKTKFNSRNIMVLEADQFRTALLDNMHPNNIPP